MTFDVRPDRHLIRPTYRSNRFVLVEVTAPAAQTGRARHQRHHQSAIAVRRTLRPFHPARRCAGRGCATCHAAHTSGGGRSGRRNRHALGGRPARHRVSAHS